MKARIVNYRGGVNTQNPRQLIVDSMEISKKDEARRLLGKKVEWITPSGKKIIGKVTRVHGSKGNVVVRFNKGLPGQAIGTDVEILV